MRHSIAFVSVLASVAMAADTTTIDFLFPGQSEGTDPVATIKNVNPTTTEMYIACPSGTDSNDCGWGSGLDYTIISKTHYKGALTEDSMVMSYGCDYNSAKSDMTCVVAVTGGDMTDSGDMENPAPATATSTLSKGQFALIHATVVSGASLLQATASGAAPTSASASAAASAAAAASSGLKTDAMPSSTVSAASMMKSAASSHASQSASGSAAAAQATGAAVRYGIQGSALVALAGAAAAGLF